MAKRVCLNSILIFKLTQSGSRKTRLPVSGSLKRSLLLLVSMPTTARQARLCNVCQASEDESICGTKFQTKTFPLCVSGLAVELN